MRIRAAVKVETRAALIREGARLFAELGFAATTIEQVAAAAGTAKGTVYNYFRTKEDLAVAVVLSTQLESAPEMKAAAVSPRPVRERLCELSALAVRWIQANPELTMVWSAQRLLRGRADGVSEWSACLVRAIEAGQERDEVRTDRPALLMGVELEGIHLVYVTLWYHTGQNLDLSLALQQAINAYLEGARSRAEGGN